jgi:hypothetical protein
MISVCMRIVWALKTVISVMSTVRVWCTCIVSRDVVREKMRRGVEKYRYDQAMAALEQEPKLDLAPAQLFVLANVHELKYILEVTSKCQTCENKILIEVCKSVVLIRTICKSLKSFEILPQLY